MKKIITRTILVLSLVSLFNDISSEMLIPIMPVFLQSIGFSTLLIGILEGFAEAVAGFSKMYFGKKSDESGKQMLFVRSGYVLSAFSKSMLAFTTFVPCVFLARSADKIGKGIRTGARDALLSDETLPENKATVFGFHRAFDTGGAALGPLVALIYLHFHPQQYAALFLIAFAPSVLSVAFTFFITEKKKEIVTKNNSSFAEKFFYWKKSPAEFRSLMIGLLLFGLMNSSDAFLLLRTKAISGNDSTVLITYIFYNLVYALFAFPLGRIADKIGMKKVIVIGLLLFSMVYTGMAFAENVWMIVVLFFIYGIYAAATEGVAKALISNTVAKAETATAIGFYTGWNSICTFIASSATGFIWYRFSPEAAFLISAAGTTLVVIYLGIVKLRSGMPDQM